MKIVKQAARDTGLIGGHHNLIPGIAQSGNRFDATRDRDAFVVRFDEGVRVFIDNAVTIQNDQFAHHSVLRIKIVFGADHQACLRCVQAGNISHMQEQGP